MHWGEHTLSLLIDRHAPVVRGVLRRFSTDADALADLAQETFLRALVCLPSLRDPNAFGPWVASIARNVALERLRSSKRERSHLQRASEALIPPEPDEVAEAGLAQVGRGCPAEARAALEACAEGLTEAHKSAVRLRRTWTPNDGYTGQYPYDRDTGAEIAEALRQLAIQLGDSAKLLSAAGETLELIT